MAPRKRGHEEVDEAPEETPQRDLKQPKTDAAAQAAAESNSDSSYVSAAAAVFSESEGESDTARSSHDQSDSELSTSSEEPSSEEDESESGEDDDGASQASDVQEEITNVRPGSKPNIRKEGTDSSLLRRLKTFLPEMHEANEQLDKEREDGTLDKRNIEACDEDGQHIEMVSEKARTLQATKLIVA